MFDESFKCRIKIFGGVLMTKKTGAINHSDYKDWIIYLKNRVRQVQLKAAVAVNEQLLNFYWELGSDIVKKQKHSTWGDKFLEQLSRDLMFEFPDMKGFSFRNLKYVRQWFSFWNNELAIGQQAVAQFWSDESLIRQQAVAKLTQLLRGTIFIHKLKLLHNFNCSMR